MAMEPIININDDGDAGDGSNDTGNESAIITTSAPDKARKHYRNDEATTKKTTQQTTAS